MSDNLSVIILLILVGLPFCMIGCAEATEDLAAEQGVVFNTPGTGDRPIPSFQNDVLPILKQRCALAGCHTANGPQGIDLRTYKSVTASGGSVVADDALASRLVTEIVNGNMPPDGPPLSTDQIQLIVDWINEGAKNN